MKTITEQLAFYAAYHRNPYNIATHFVGIPAIIIGILIPMGWLRVHGVALPISGALAFVVAVWIYYLLLDRTFAFLALLPIVPAFLIADAIARMAWGPSIAWAFLLFVGGWIFQLVGHSVFEKRKPAFLDNLIQLLIGPLFLLAETVFALGFRKDLHDAVQTVSHQFDPVSDA